MPARLQPSAPLPRATWPASPREVTLGGTGRAPATPSAWRIAASRMLMGDENHGMHHVFVRVIGPDGKGVNGVKVAFMPEGEERVLAVGETRAKDYPFALDPNRPGPGDGDPRGDQAGWVDFPLSKGPRYQVRVLDASGSEVARGITTLVWSTATRAEDGAQRGDHPVEYTGRDPSDGNFMGHWSYLVVFQAGGGRDGATVAPLTTSDVLDGVPVRRPPLPAPLPGPPTSPAPRTGEGLVVVRPGDTLMSIAQAELGDPARWPEIWRLNEGRIGAAPYALRPGTKLMLPAPPWLPPGN